MTTQGKAPSPLEAKVLTAWEGCRADFGYLSFAAVSNRSGVAPHQIRRAVRALARKGYVVFGKGLWSDDGEPAGSGYGLTEQGLAAIQEKETA